MNIDLWGLGLQAVNVLILVWLLTRVFWRPVAAAITARQAAAQALLSDAQAVRTEAEATRDALSKARDGIAVERSATLARAAAEAATAATATLSKARDKAAKLVEDAQALQARDAETARNRQTAQAATLAVEIAGKLLQRLDPVPVQAAFLALLVKSITTLPVAERAALAAQSGLVLVSATALDSATQARVSAALAQALGHPAELTFLADPRLIAGFQLRADDIVLHDSWRSDLDVILKDLRHAA